MLRWLRFTVFAALFIFYSLILNLFVICCKRASWFQPINQRLLKVWAKLIFGSVQIKIDISPEDQAKLNHSEARIVIANHNSHLDSIALWIAMPQGITLCFAAKRQLYKIPFFGRLLASTGSPVINRENPKEAYESLKKFFMRKLARTLVVYAEGTRNTTQKDLLPFKRGPFVVAQEMELPILPVLIHGAAETMPVGSRLPRSGIIKIKVLDPIPKEEVKQQSFAQLKTHTWQLMKEAMDPGSAK